MKQIIVDAINSKCRISCVYNDKPRVIEPQCYGMGHRGTELLRVYQLHGESEREPLFNVAKIQELVTLDEHFTQPGPNYKKNDSAMKEIFAQL